jgi:hypothetical protein
VGQHKALLKVCYLLAVTAVVFAWPPTTESALAKWAVIAALLTAQAVVLLVCRIRVAEIIAPLWRLKWLFATFIVLYGLLPPQEPCCDVLVESPVPGLAWSIFINVSGLQQAGLMCLQIVTVVLTSLVVRVTGSGRDLVEGLQAFRLPDLFIHSLDQTLATFSGGKRPGHRREGAAGASSFFSFLRDIARGDFTAFVRTVERNMQLARERTREDSRKLGSGLAHDVGLVTAIALCMASVKIVKVLPGVPFASGHKTFLLFPLYVLAARLTHSRWGGTAAGSITGVIGFLQGDGRLGVLEILKHIAAGLVIDLGEPFARRLPPWALGYFGLGFTAAIAWSATEFVLLALLGARAEIYLFPAARLLPNLLAGTLSGFVTTAVLRVFASSPAAAVRDDERREDEHPVKDPPLPAPRDMPHTKPGSRVPGSGAGSRGGGLPRRG